MRFDESTLRKLQSLALVASRARAGALKGERRSTRRGAGIEFADYRDYVAGDDLRRLDWNVYARLDRPFIRLREEQEDLAVHVLVDDSQSMDWGDGAHRKFDYALRLAAALGAIALGSGDRVKVRMLNSSEVAVSGPANLLRLLSFLDKQSPAGTTDLDRALREYALTARRPGLAILISDLFSPGGCQLGLEQLQSRGHDVAVIHLLAPDELDPQLAGDLQLVDVETGQTQEVSLDSGLRQSYRRRVHAWRDELQAYCRRRGMRYLRLSTDRAWDEAVLHEMRRAGIAK